MSAIIAALPVYARLAAMVPKTVLAYRFNIVMSLISVLLQIYLLRVVWSAIYAERTDVQAFPLEQLLTYLTIANLQIWLVNPQPAWNVQQRVREGQIAVDIARPVPFPGQMVAQHVGETIGVAPLVAAALPVAFIAGSLRPPASVESGVLYLVSLAVAFAVMSLMGLLLGFVAFWTLETTGMMAIFRFANLFFAGGLVPLAFFPSPLRTVAEALPFQTQASIPVSLYLGRLEGADALRALALQLVWLALLGVLAVAVWRRAVSKIVVQGG
ncbi:MAG TPA: ABC-2 family transporter protein [Candidatus Limnocylindria bacterium]|nr:ABC-2 family transporter protein [Candidatus Limnocylindria bacterium]